MEHIQQFCPTGLARVLPPLMGAVLGVLMLAGVARAGQSGDFTWRNVAAAGVEIVGYTGTNEVVVVPETLDGLRVLSIGDGVMSGNQRLASVQLPAGLTNLGSGVFYYCSALTNVSLPAELLSVGGFAFSDCARLAEVALPDGLTKLGAYAFQNCSNLTQARLPEQLVYLGMNAFLGCSGLTNAHLGAKLITLGDSPFFGCTRLSAITVAAGNPVYSDIDGVLFDKRQTILLQYPMGRDGRYRLPDSVVDVGFEAFANCGHLRALTLSPKLATIQAAAFMGCRDLSRLFVPSGLQYIGARAFEGSSVGWLFFEGPSPWVVDYDLPWEAPEQLCYLAGASGWESTYSRRSTSTWLKQTPYSYRKVSLLIANQACFGVELLQYSGPGGTVDIPDTVDGNPVLSLGDWLFADRQDITRVTVPDRVVSVGDGVFAECSGLAGAYFKGNAPGLGGSLVFHGIAQATAYYMAGATGWTNPFGGLPTALWNPEFNAWVATNGLAAKYPDADGAQNDPDHDGLTNWQEMNAGTDPTEAKSTLAFETVARPEALCPEDQTTLADNQFALYFQSVPGKSYDVLSSATVNGAWNPVVQITATTAQKRVVLDRPAGSAFYRVAVHE
jgi:hypothetical protein